MGWRAFPIARHMRFVPAQSFAITSMLFRNHRSCVICRAGLKRLTFNSVRRATIYFLLFVRHTGEVAIPASAKTLLFSATHSHLSRSVATLRELYQSVKYRTD